MQHRRCSSIVALAAAFAFVASPVLADGVDVTESASGLVVTISTEAANIHFDFVPEGCDGHTPCLLIGAGVGTGGTPVSASGNCTARQGGDMAPSGIECPAAAASSITFVFKKGGTWSAYEGGGGQHTGPCSPVPVTVQTGPDGLAVVVTSWDGCPETVICDSPKTMFTAVEADAADTIRGTCSSIVRH
jgi:hypothetical protein